MPTGAAMTAFGAQAETLRATRVVMVGSLNRVKVGAVSAVLERAGCPAQVRGISVPSGVAEQPFGDEETIRGARARAQAALAAVPEASLAIGLEGGCVETPSGGLRTCAWAVAVDREGREGVGGSLAMPLPPRVAQLVRDGMELGHAMDAVSGGTDTKTQAGAVGILTDGLIDRQRAYETLVTYALAPWLAPSYWSR